MTQQVLTKNFEGSIRFTVRQTKVAQEKKVTIKASFDTSQDVWRVHVVVTGIINGEFEFSVSPKDMADLHGDVCIKVRNKVLQHLLAQRRTQTAKSFHFSGKWS